ncbi:MAG: FHA domain-containing protein [Hyphomicrobiaceae bacterium]|nr:FHA domain-containing protein [Hyphomicrobiaceae bacterium]
MAGKPGDEGGERRPAGSLREALAAAARSEPPAAAAVAIAAVGANERVPPAIPPPTPLASTSAETERKPALPSASQAAMEARGGATADVGETPSTRVVRASAPRGGGASPARTQLVRGKAPAKRVDFHQDPVVGWLVVVGGAGLGAFRPIFEGNNTIGRAPGQRIPIDFGDETISNEEQAYIRYDSVDRRFLLVPNLAKTNIVAVNDRKPTAAVELAAMDVITMGRTQLVFVPFCGSEFDWGELTEMQG